VYTEVVIEGKSRIGTPVGVQYCLRLAKRSSSRSAFYDQRELILQRAAVEQHTTTDTCFARADELHSSDCGSFLTQSNLIRYARENLSERPSCLLNK